MKSKKTKQILIALAVVLLCGLVYYWFFYTPSLSDYVYIERPNQYSYVIHSKESCSEIRKGVFRYKTSDAIKALNEQENGILYCSKCMSYGLIEKYISKIKAQEESIASIDCNSIAIVDETVVDSVASDSAATDYEY